MKQKRKANSLIKIGVFIVFIMFFLFFASYFIPALTQLINGENIINRHIEETYFSKSLQGNINDSFIWLKNAYYPLKEDKIIPLYKKGNGIYRSNYGLKLFIRPSNPSWFILTKTGRCGEYAGYMSEIFERLGYDIRTVFAAGGDHNIIQILDNNSFYFIDPSAQNILNHSTYFEKGQWGRIIAITTNGSRLDLTNEILTNKSNISLEQNTTQNVKTSIKSTYLMSNDGKYKEPRLVYQFQSKNESIIISSGKKYVIENYRDFGLFKFSIEENIDLTNDSTIYSQGVSINFKNFKIKIMGYIVLSIICIIIFFFNFKWIKKKFKHLFPH